ncbi:hypothetical protein [Deinococcus maricopensis]|nr:hypothetical protein [Deinococcus maricopensis]
MNPSFRHTFTQLATFLTAQGWPTDTYRFTALGENIAIIGCDRGQLYVRLPDDTEAPLARLDRTGTLHINLATLARMLRQHSTDPRALLTALHPDLGTLDLRTHDHGTDALIEGSWQPLVRANELIGATLLRARRPQAA